MAHDGVMTQTNMRIPLWNGVSHDRRVNIDESVDCYQLALQNYTQELMPDNWEKAKVKMGNALQERISGDQKVNINESVKC